jgi:hypothetical protein
MAGATPAQNASGTGYSAEGYAPGSAVSSQYVPGTIRITPPSKSPAPNPEIEQSQPSELNAIFNPANSIFAPGNDVITQINSKGITPTPNANPTIPTTFNLGGQQLNAQQALQYAQMQGLTPEQYQEYGAALQAVALQPAPSPKPSGFLQINQSTGEGGGGAARAATGGNQNTPPLGTVTTGNGSTFTNVGTTANPLYLSNGVVYSATGTPLYAANPNQTLVGGIAVGGNPANPGYTAQAVNPNAPAYVSPTQEAQAFGIKINTPPTNSTEPLPNAQLLTNQAALAPNSQANVILLQPRRHPDLLF